MLKEERFDFIINRLKSNQSVKLGALSVALDVSEDTVRRDIDELAKHGLVTKVRGGALPHSPNAHNFQERIHVDEHQKIAIARKALRLIKAGDTILLDGGTTTYALAGLLDMPLTVITNNIPAAALLAGKKNIEVMITGGRILPDSQVAAGEYAIRMLEQSHVDWCFLGICSIHELIGVTSIDYFECEMKRAMVGCSDNIVALTGHDKIGTSEAYKICPIGRLHSVITDIDPAHEMFEPYRMKNIQIS